MSLFLLSCIQTIVVLALAPLSLGLVRSFKARLQGRRGASPFLPYVTVATMLRKEDVVPSGASWAFRAGPIGVLAPMLFLAVMIPTVSAGDGTGYGNLFVLSGALVLGVAFLVFGAMDAGSAFGGMGSSREMTIAALVEPVLMTALVAVAVVRGTTSLDGMIASAASGTIPFLLLPVAALLLVALAENARYPVDNPATHLELTMVHEAMLLNHSGPSLAMLEYASALKLTVLPLFVANVLFPIGVLSRASPLAAVPMAAAVAVAKLAVLMGILALIESSIAKMRFFRVQEYLSGAFLLAVAGLVLALIRRAAL